MPYKMPHLMSPAPGDVQMPRSSRCLAVRLMACSERFKNLFC